MSARYLWQHFEGQTVLLKEQTLPHLTGACISKVRQDMNGCGFALVDTPPFLRETLHPRIRRGRTVLPCHDKRWVRYPELAQYACWLEAIVGEALPEEAAVLTSLEFRREPRECEDPEVDRLHADGSYLRSVWTLYGPATIYRDEGVERQVPRGQTLLMTAMGRARAVSVRCTLHRRPGAGPERAVIVCSFEPRPEQPPRELLYQKITPAHHSCS